MIKTAALAITCALSLNGLYAQEQVVIVGGGIIGALEAYHAIQDAAKNDVPIRVTVYEKGPGFEEGPSTNTACNICPSLTPDEILSVVPRGSELVEKLAYLFNEPGGIRVDDVPGANDSPTAIQFKEAVQLYGRDPNHGDRTEKLLELGKLSMELWQSLYDEADPELKGILERSNFNPCREPRGNEQALHDGYRIDLIYGVPNAKNKAQGMKDTYGQLGYSQCRLLSPEEVMTIDPALFAYCKSHAKVNADGILEWIDDAAALWRPGGCLAAQDFLPLFYSYLKKLKQDSFNIEFKREVVGIDLDNEYQISALRFKDGTAVQNDPQSCRYVLCPGEAVGTLQKFGFDEPTFAGFAGPSILLDIPLSQEEIDRYKSFSHCMEVHKVGIVLAWQGRFKENRLILQAAGTKAFYADKTPHIDEAFAKDRHLVQLNMMNDVLPEMVSIGFGRDTYDKTLSFDDLCELEEKKVLVRWVGRRAVAYDGFPTLGALYANGHKIKNARCTTHLGSGGVSFAPAAIEISRHFEEPANPFASKILEYADSRR